MTYRQISDSIYLFRGETNCAAIIQDDRVLLIDCSWEDMGERLQQAGLPLPEVVLHTQVQEEHCREWASCPEAEVFVHAPAIPVARRSPTYFQQCETVWPPDRPWDPEDRGHEKYTIAGCKAMRPPREPLNVAGGLVPGEAFYWGDVTLEIKALPGSGKFALGFYWAAEDVLFSGDLMKQGGYLCNWFDLERGYGIDMGHRQALESLGEVESLHPELIIPATGKTIDSPARDINRLKDRLRAYLHPPEVPGIEPSVTAKREFDVFREYPDRIYQCNQGGPMLLFVRQNGEGLCVDPDICVWHGWEANNRIMQRSLDSLRDNTCLECINTVLITHYHADHFEYAYLLRERYDTQVITTPRVAALMMFPADFDLPCMIPWYDLPFESFTPDATIQPGESFDWNGITIQAIWTPGHCYAHAGYVLEWMGQRVACVGDSLQYTDGPILEKEPILYNDAAWPDRGTEVTYRHLLEFEPDLILGGHGSGFYDPEGKVVKAHLKAFNIKLRRAQALIDNDALRSSMTPPGYDAMRERLHETAERVRRTLPHVDALEPRGHR